MINDKPQLGNRFRKARPYGGTTRPLTTPLTKYQRRTQGPPRGGFHNNGHALTPLQQLVKDIDAVYRKYVLKDEIWPAPRTIGTIIEKAVNDLARSLL